MRYDEAPGIGDALQDVAHSSQRLLADRFELMCLEAKQALVHTAVRAGSRLLAGMAGVVALILFTVAACLYLSTTMPGFAATAVVGGFYALLGAVLWFVPAMQQSATAEEPVDAAQQRQP